MKEEIERRLREASVSPTPIRIMVYRILSDSSVPLSLSDMEIALESVDKSTISRTLTTFKNHHLVHSFNDGSGSVKFELCRSLQEENDEDAHVHFRCEKCGITKCMTEVSIPPVVLPEGYEMHEVNYIITGVCSNCSR